MLDSFYIVFVPVWYVLRLVLVGWAAFYLISYLIGVLKK